MVRALSVYCEGAKHSHGWLIWDIIRPAHSAVPTSTPGTPEEVTFGQERHISHQCRYGRKYPVYRSLRWERHQNLTAMIQVFVTGPHHYAVRTMENWARIY